jgi:hypothetical protein
MNCFYDQSKHFLNVQKKVESVMIELDQNCPLRNGDGVQ